MAPILRPKSKIKQALRYSLDVPTSVCNKPGVIYMIQTPRDSCKRTPVWKVGYTCQAFEARLRQYPRGTQVIATFHVKNSRRVERKVMRSFRRTYTLDRGAEYFIGDKDVMLRHLCRIVHWDIVD